MTDLPLNGSPEQCPTVFWGTQCSEIPVAIILVGCICEYIRQGYACRTCIRHMRRGYTRCALCLEKGYTNTLSLIKVVEELCRDYPQTSSSPQGI